MPRSRFVLTAAVACAFSASAAGAAPSAVSLTVTPRVVHRGHLVLMRGSAGDCPVGDAVTIISRAFARTHEFAGVPAVFAKVRSGGAFRATTRIPANRRAGLYGITARCGGGNLGLLVRLRVLR
jgi:hypothetical protein